MIMHLAQLMIAQHLENFALGPRWGDHLARHRQAVDASDLVAEFKTAGDPGGFRRNQFLFTTSDQLLLLQKMHRVDHLILQKGPYILNITDTAPPNEKRADVQSRIGSIVAHVPDDTHGVTIIETERIHGGFTSRGYQFH